MNEGLLRQRRNLISICAFLWLLKYGQVEFSKFSFVGFDISFKRPEALYVCLWIAFAYFFYRYYQYFVRYAQDELVAQYKGAIEHLAVQWMAQIHRVHPGWETKVGYPKFIELLRSGFVVRAEERISLTKPQDGTKPFEFKMNRTKVLGSTLLAISESTLRSTVVTDYLLPIALSLFVIFYCGGGDWPGSLLNTLTG